MVQFHRHAQVLLRFLCSASTVPKMCKYYSQNGPPQKLGEFCCVYNYKITVKFYSSINNKTKYSAINKINSWGLAYLQTMTSPQKTINLNDKWSKPRCIKTDTWFLTPSQPWQLYQGTRYIYISCIVCWFSVTICFRPQPSAHIYSSFCVFLGGQMTPSSTSTHIYS